MAPLLVLRIRCQDKEVYLVHGWSILDVYVCILRWLLLLSSVSAYPIYKGVSE